MAPTRATYFGRGLRLVSSAGIPRATVRRVGGVLRHEGVFEDRGDNFVDVFLLTRDDHLEVRVFVDENAWGTGGELDRDPRIPPGGRRAPPAPDLDHYLRGGQRALAAGPLAGSEVRLVVCSTFGKQLAVLP